MYGVGREDWNGLESAWLTFFLSFLWCLPALAQQELGASYEANASVVESLMGRTNYSANKKRPAAGAGVADATPKRRGTLIT